MQLMDNLLTQNIDDRSNVGFLFLKEIARGIYIAVHSIRVISKTP